MTCKCGIAHDELFWTRPELQRRYEKFRRELLLRGDYEPIRNNFKVDVQAGEEIWDASKWCPVCQVDGARSGKRPGEDRVGLHLAFDHVYLATGGGKSFLADQKAVLSTMSLTGDWVIGLSTERAPVSEELVRFEQKFGVRPPYDRGTSEPIMDTFSVFCRQSPRAGWDVTSILRQKSMAGGNIKAAVFGCIGGCEGHKRYTGLMHYGPKLAEVVFQRNDIVERWEPAADHNAIRVLTAPAHDLPAWPRWVIQQHHKKKLVDGIGACDYCRSEVRSFMVDWVLNGRILRW